jgi:hypothetical protein
MALSYQIGFTDGAQDVDKDLFWYNCKFPKYLKGLDNYSSEYHRGYVEGYLSIPWPQLQFFFVGEDDQ